MPITFRKSSKRKKKKSNDQEEMPQMVQIINKMVDNNPVTEYLQLLRDEMKATREHEM